MSRFKDLPRIAWAGKHVKYSPPSGLDTIFPEMIRANKKDFIFRQGKCSMNVPHSSLSKSFALNICSMGSYENLNLGIFLQDYLQPNVSQVATMMSLWKMITVFRSLSWSFSFPHHITCLVRQSLQIFTEKGTS